MAKKKNKPKEQKVQFGKYKGRIMYWVVQNDLSYAIWLLKQSNSNTKTKRAIQSILDKDRAKEDA